MAKDGLGEQRVERRAGALVRVRRLVLPSQIIAEVEAEIAAAMELDHPAVVRVTSVRQVPGGLEVESQAGIGVTLRKFLTALGDRAEKLAVSHATWIAQEVLKVLQLAQSRMADGKLAPVIHGRLSPGNIVLTKNGEVRIAGWGLDPAARFLLKPDEALDRTYGYVAPEQRDAQPPRPESDLFALGSILAEMVSGEPAFVGRTLKETFDAAATRVAPRLRNRRPEVPLALDEAVSWALEKTPEKRPRAEAYISRLNAFQGVLDVGDRVKPGEHAIQLSHLIRLRLSKEEVEDSPTDAQEAPALDAAGKTPVPAPAPKKKGIRASRVVLALAVVLLAWAAVVKAKWASWGPGIAQLVPALARWAPPVASDAGVHTLGIGDPLPPLPSHPPPDAGPTGGDAGVQAPLAAPEPETPKKPGHLTVKGPKGRLLLDGKDVGALPIADLAVPPGEHHLEWQGPHARATERVFLLPGGKKTVTLKPKKR